MLRAMNTDAPHVHVSEPGHSVIIDAHQHLWDAARGAAWSDAPGHTALRRAFTIADLREAIRSTSVDRTVLVEAGGGNSSEIVDLLATAKAAPEIAGAVAWVDLSKDDLTDTLQSYFDQPGNEWLVGTRAHVFKHPDPAYLERRDVRRGLNMVADHGLIFDLIARTDQLPSCANMAEEMPNLTFVVDHLGLPRIDAGEHGLAQWSALISPLAACPNVAAKLSGLLTLAHGKAEAISPFVATAVELFGPERLMLGSDWPVCLRAASYQRTWEVLTRSLPRMTVHEKALVSGGTAIRTYGLSKSDPTIRAAT